MKRIFMVSSHPLFSQGVETLLRQNAEIRFVGREADVDKAIECVKILRPDVVIVDHEFSSCTQAPALLQILNAGVGAKVIGLNLLTNTMCIYRGEQKLALDVDDLLRAIESDPNEPELARVEKIGKED